MQVVRVACQPVKRGPGTSGTATGFCGIRKDWLFWQHVNFHFLRKIEVFALDVADPNSGSKGEKNLLLSQISLCLMCKDI